MYSATRKEPEHESARWRHHPGILLGLLFDFLILGELGSVVAWNLLLEPFSMRWRIEFGGLLQANDFRGRCSGRRMFTGR